MTVEITARHLDISDSLNEFARAKADKLGGEFPAIESIRVVMDEDGPFFSAVVTVRGGRNMNADGSHRDADIHVAITEAFERVATQLRRNMQKNNDTRA